MHCKTDLDFDWFWLFCWSLVIPMEYFIIELDSMKTWGLCFVTRCSSHWIGFELCFFWIFKFTSSLPAGASLTRVRPTSGWFDWWRSFEFVPCCSQGGSFGWSVPHLLLPWVGWCTLLVIWSYCSCHWHWIPWHEWFEFVSFAEVSVFED